ncbi:hypothetical protein OGAPHI_003842 [Ogataea philodendri]|uniref:Uncharacterized protein n=1 Tax=Ogataea philodendri TaxID=1378263 RepID=A0A9P8P6Q1_9ASCO|nr:uncharacterized protein OGAPHI_003842 [Ogataea philodendri]KAH3665654.1 hypothetical protein OGAPHI_003842 [Ogataea philodendri]
MVARSGGSISCGRINGLEPGISGLFSPAAAAGFLAACGVLPVIRPDLFPHASKSLVEPNPDRLPEWVEAPTAPEEGVVDHDKDHHHGGAIGGLDLGERRDRTQCKPHNESAHDQDRFAAPALCEEPGRNTAENVQQGVDSREQNGVSADPAGLFENQWCISAWNEGAVPERNPTPIPETNRPIAKWAIDDDPDWILPPMQKIKAPSRVVFLRPSLSEMGPKLKDEINAPISKIATTVPISRAVGLSK